MQMAQTMTEDIGERPRITRRRGACKLCRQKKSRCTGDQPCTRCKRCNVTCVYEPPEAPATSSVNIINRSRAASDSVAFLSHLSTTPAPSSLESIDWFLGYPSTPTAAPFCLTLGDPVESGTSDSAYQDGPRSLPESDREQEVAPGPEQDLEEHILNPEHLCFSPHGHVSNINHNDHSYTTYDISSGSESVQGDGSKTKDSLLYLDDGATDIARHRRLLFPALHRNKSAPPQYSPSFSTLTLRVNQSGLDSLAKQTVTRAVTSLLSQDYQTSLPAAWANLPLGQPEPPLSVETLQNCIRRCFEDPWGVRSFLDASAVLSLTEGMLVFDHRHGASGSLVDRYLLNTLVAISMLLRAHEHDPGQLCKRLLMAAEMEAGVLAEADSIHKFLALVATLHLYNRLGLGCLPQLLASVVSLIRSMSLHSEQAFSGLRSHSHQDMDRAKRACWLVFCIDNEYALRCKTFSILQESVITYDLPLEPIRRHHHHGDTAHDGGNTPDWLQIRRRYAQICAQICAATTSTDTGNTATTTADLITKLEDWYASVPSEFRIHHKATVTTSYARHMTIALLYRYHEARQAILESMPPTSSSSCQMMIHQPPRPPPLSPSILLLSPVITTGEQSPRTPIHPAAMPSSTSSISSIKQVFEAAYKIEDVLYDRSFLYMPTICLCKLVVECITGGGGTGRSSLLGSPGVPMVDGREARTLLAMAHGFFGRISGLLPTEGYFDMVTELIHVGVMTGTSRVGSGSGSGVW